MNTESHEKVDTTDCIPTIDILDPYEYVSHKTPITKFRVLNKHGEITRVGTFSRTKKCGYMFE